MWPWSRIKIREEDVGNSKQKEALASLLVAFLVAPNAKLPSVLDFHPPSLAVLWGLFPHYQSSLLPMKVEGQEAFSLPTVFSHSLLR